jgi:hypothetical protein
MSDTQPMLCNNASPPRILCPASNDSENQDWLTAPAYCRINVGAIVKLAPTHTVRAISEFNVSCNTFNCLRYNALTAEVAGEGHSKRRRIARTESSSEFGLKTLTSAHNSLVQSCQPPFQIRVLDIDRHLDPAYNRRSFPGHARQP